MPQQCLHHRQRHRLGVADPWGDTSYKTPGNPLGKALEKVIGPDIGQLEALVGADTAQLAGRLHQEWDTDRPGARAAAQSIAAGTGRIGQHRGAVRRARDHLQGWAQQWRPIVASLPAEADLLAVLAAGDDDPSLARGQCRRRRRTLHDKRAPARTIRGELRTQAQTRDRPLKN